MSWKSGTVEKIGKTKGGLDMLKFKRAKPKEGQTQHFLVVLQIGSVVPKVGDNFDCPYNEERDKLHGYDTYYELPTPTKGDTHLVPGEHKASDDFGTQDPSQIEVVICDKSDTIEALVLSFEQALMVSSAAARASGKEGMNHEQWFDRIVATARAKSRVTK